jgi:hypothetical protein
MKKIIKLTESDLEKIVKKVLKESSLINEIESDAEDLDGSQETVNVEINNFNQNAPSDQKQNMKLIQSKLKELGYNLGTFGPNKDGVDGNYGRRTLMAIKDFQRKNGIKQTTWDSARNVLWLCDQEGALFGLTREKDNQIRQA